MNRTAVAVGVFVLVAGILWALVISSGDEPEVANLHAPPAPPAAPSVPAPAPAAAAEPAAPAASPRPSEPAAPAPAAPAQPTPAEDPAPPEDRENRVPVPENVGNLELLRGRFEQEPRDSAAADEEAKIQATFRANNMPAGLLASALCRQTVCRTVFNWTEARAEGYMGGLMQLSEHFEMQNMAIDEGSPDADGARTVQVYFERKR